MPQRLYRRRRPLQVEGRRQPLDRPDRRAVLQPAAASARSRSSPATRRRSSSGQAPRAPVASAARAARVSTVGRTSPALRTSGSGARRTAGRRSTLVSQGNATNCTTATPTEVFNGLTPCSPRGARRVHFDPVDPNTVYATFWRQGHLALELERRPGHVGADLRATRPGRPARPRARTSSAPSSTSWRYQTARRACTWASEAARARPPKFFRSDSVRAGAPTFTELTNNTSAGLLRPAVQLRQLRLRAAEGRRDGTRRRHRLPARRQRLHPGWRRERRTAARSCCRPTQAYRSRT